VVAVTLNLAAIPTRADAFAGCAVIERVVGVGIAMPIRVLVRVKTALSFSPKEKPPTPVKPRA
jgi:hypothetical protein